LKVREILRIQDFDPLDVDISFLKEVSSQIPQEGYIDPAMAEKLATVCLTAADRAADLLAQATLYLSHCDANRRSARASAIADALARKVPSTLAKELCASDEAYQKSCDKYDVALGWHTWLETKRDTLIKTHHLCKDLVRKFDDNMSTNWDPPDSESKKLSKTLTEDQSELEEVELTKKVGKISWT
jgi:hypothetical protein